MATLRQTTLKAVRSPIRVSVVGSAGRNEDGRKMNSDLFTSMIDKTADVITNRFKLDMERVHLVSGGAAWSDHVAVVLYVHGRVPSLSLHLPAKWVEEPHPQFHEGDRADRKRNPGKVANAYHKQFSQKIKEDTLQQIQFAMYMGASFKVHDGFLQRNSHVAQSEYLIAFTWGEGDVPKNGGTHDTWTKCKNTKIHIPLHSLLPTLPKAPSVKRLAAVPGHTAISTDVSAPCTKKQKEEAEGKP